MFPMIPRRRKTESFSRTWPSSFRPTGAEFASTLGCQGGGVKVPGSSDPQRSIRPSGPDASLLSDSSPSSLQPRATALSSLCPKSPPGVAVHSGRVEGFGAGLHSAGDLCECRESLESKLATGIAENSVVSIWGGGGKLIQV